MEEEGLEYHYYSGVVKDVPIDEHIQVTFSLQLSQGFMSRNISFGANDRDVDMDHIEPDMYFFVLRFGQVWHNEQILEQPGEPINDITDHILLFADQIKKSKNVLKAMSYFIKSTSRDIRRFRDKRINKESVIRFMIRAMT